MFARHVSLRPAVCACHRTIGVAGISAQSVAAAAAQGGHAPLQPDAGGGGGSAGGGCGSSGGLPPAADGVELTYRGRTLQAERGATLRSAMLQAGVTPHNGRATLINCRGLGTCGTCAVEIRGEVEPLEWTTQERLRLNFPPHGPPTNQRLRLACQVACLGDLQVIKREGFWGQYEPVLPDIAAATGSDGSAAAGSAAAAGTVTPLGQLEYVLDRRRLRRQGSSGGGGSGGSSQGGTP